MLCSQARTSAKSTNRLTRDAISIFVWKSNVVVGDGLALSCCGCLIHMAQICGNVGVAERYASPFIAIRVVVYFQPHHNEWKKQQHLRSHRSVRLSSRTTSRALCHSLVHMLTHTHTHTTPGAWSELEHVYIREMVCYWYWNETKRNETIIKLMTYFLLNWWAEYLELHGVRNSRVNMYIIYVYIV